MTAAIHSFSNLYPCPVVNGSYTKYWCCGEKESSAEAAGGCCYGQLFELQFGHVILGDLNPSTLASSSSYIASSPSSGVVKSADAKRSTPSSSSSHVATYPSSVASPTLPSLSEPAVTATIIPAGLSSGPAQPSRKNIALGPGIGVPVAALLFLGLFLLFLRERRRRLHAQRMADNTYAAAEAREREREMKRAKAVTTARDYELRNNWLPQELEYVPHSPKEIDSRDVYEMNHTN